MLNTTSKSIYPYLYNVISSWIWGEKSYLILHDFCSIFIWVLSRLEGKKKESEMVQLYYMKHFAVVRDFQGILLMALTKGPKIQ